MNISTTTTTVSNHRTPPNPLSSSFTTSKFPIKPSSVGYTLTNSTHSSSIIVLASSSSSSSYKGSGGGGGLDVSPAKKLRELLDTPGVHQGPAVFNALSAKLVEKAGFQFCFTTEISIHEIERTVFALAFEGMKHVKSEEEEMLYMPFLDVCKHILPVIDHLCVFPPKSVQVRLKRPFSVHPWIDSEEHVGNLFLVRSHASFHFSRKDSRLMREVHIAFLKLIIKDIEDVARTPSGGPKTNQYTVANPEGGHPQIVEGMHVGL
nr:homeobox-DDT domain protein RLT1-like isoform X2 [Tanacetum cinerariifolium]